MGATYCEQEKTTRFEASRPSERPYSDRAKPGAQALPPSRADTASGQWALDAAEAVREGDGSRPEFSSRLMQSGSKKGESALGQASLVEARRSMARR